MERNKKGADAGTPAPSQNELTPEQVNSSRLKRICPTILLIAVICFLVAYHKQAINAMYLTAGVIITSCVFEIIINPISNEEENEYED